MFGKSETTTVECVLNFMLRRLDIRRSTQIKDGENFWVQTKVKVVKNKVAPPFKNCRI